MHDNHTGLKSMGIMNNKYRLILLEDNLMAQEFIAEELLKLGCELTVYASPREFIMAGKPESDLIISDWNFGHVDLTFFINELDLSKLIILMLSLDFGICTKKIQTNITFNLFNILFAIKDDTFIRSSLRVTSKSRAGFDL